MRCTGEHSNIICPFIYQCERVSKGNGEYFAETPFYFEDYGIECSEFIKHDKNHIKLEK